VNIDQLVSQLSAGEKLSLGNVLEDSAFRLLPEIEAIKLLCITMGCESSLMSGSGSCVFAVSEDKEILTPVFSYFKNIYNFVLMSEIISI
jgi:4-diphosphocytidyl-2C-methyl-D-erythritol kinase